MFMPSETPYHIYVHTPWCRSKCPYCDFTVYVDKNPPYDEWTDRIVRDAQWTQKQAKWDLEGPKTLYFGGGTPSLLPINNLQKVIETLRTPNTTEITLEVNPGDVHPEKLQQYKDIGINRLSLGIQSFDRTQLRRLGRGTTPKDIHQLLMWVQQANFDSWSMDLMFGLPNQEFQQLKDDVNKMLSVEPPHVSLYGLTYKKGTPFFRALRSGSLQPITENEWVKQFEYITNTLKSSGYTRYEVSNFCKKPHQAQHNEGIWKNEPYIGLGPSAHGFWPNGIRTQYSSTWQEWISSTVPQIEECTTEQRAIDWLITAIRHHEGILLSTLNRMGYTLKVPKHIREHDTFSKSLDCTPTRWRLSNHGWIVVDWITEVLVNALTPIDKSV